MNTVIINTLAGLLRTLAPVITLWLVDRSLPTELAGTITSFLIEGAVGALTIGMMWWSWRSNRPAAVAVQAASEPGVKVIVQQNASPEMKTLAADPAQPGVETAKKAA